MSDPTDLLPRREQEDDRERERKGGAFWRRWGRLQSFTWSEAGLIVRSGGPRLHRGWGIFQRLGAVGGFRGPRPSPLFFMLAAGIIGASALAAAHLRKTKGAGRGEAGSGLGAQARLAPVPRAALPGRQRGRSLAVLAMANSGQIRWEGPEGALRDAPNRGDVAEEADGAQDPEGGWRESAAGAGGQGAGEENGISERDKEGGKSLSLLGGLGGRRSGMLLASAANAVARPGARERVGPSGTLADAGIGSRRLADAPGLDPRRGTGHPPPAFRLGRRLRQPPPGARRYGATDRMIQHGISGRAVGQLKLANDVSSHAPLAPTDSSARGLAADAFDQRVTRERPAAPPGGAAPGDTAPAPAPGPVPSPAPIPDTGPGCPDMENPYPGGQAIEPPQDGPLPDVPPVTTPVNQTPYQPRVDLARRLMESSRGLRRSGLLLIATGTALLAVAIALRMNPFTSALGAALYAAAVAMIALGWRNVDQAGDLAAQARRLGEQVRDEDGQVEQGEVIIADASHPDDPPRLRPVRVQRGRVQEAIEIERRAGYRLEGP